MMPGHAAPALLPVSRHDAISYTIVVAIAALALLLEAWIGAREWHLLWPLTIGAAGVSALLVRWLGPLGAWPALMFAFIHPALLLAIRGNGRIVYSIVWFGAVFGVVMAGRGSRGWSMPAPWKMPLVYWGLIVAVSCPLLIAREVNFEWLLLEKYNTASSGSGGPAPVVAVWICNVVLLNLLGLLFFDWCFRVFAPTGVRQFMSAVAAPLCIGGLLGCALAIYQGAVDVAFWNGHNWPLHNRAAGGLVDGDAFGALAGFWSAASLALAAAGGWLGALGLLGVAGHWAGLWASGSRMALLAGAIGGATILAGLALSWRRVSRTARGAAIAALVIAVALPSVVRFSSANPFERAMKSLPELNRPALEKFARFELWNRGAPYGTASWQMFERYPVSGVGVSSYLTLFPDYAYTIDGMREAAQENAQSWYRQQLAELGGLGSLGWIVWLGLCVALVCRGLSSRFGIAGAALSGTLAAVGLVSIISLPTQHPAVSFTVWVFVAWLIFVTGGPDEQGRAVRWLRPSRAAWITVWCLTAVFSGSTLATGLASLRPPARAITADWTYRYGFHAEEISPEGRRFRWTEARAVEVVATRGPWLKLSMGGGPDDLASRPQRLRVWRDDELVVDEVRTDPAGDVWYLGVPSMGQRIKITIEVDRTWTVPLDGRTFGIAVGPWEFVAAPPDGARIVR